MLAGKYLYEFLRLIIYFREYCTDTTIRFVVKFAANKLREAQRSNLYKFFNLQTSQSHTNTLVSSIFLFYFNQILVVI